VDSALRMTIMLGVGTLRRLISRRHIVRSAHLPSLWCAAAAASPYCSAKDSASSRHVAATVAAGPSHRRQPVSPVASHRTSHGSGALLKQHAADYAYIGLKGSAVRSEQRHTKRPVDVARREAQPNINSAGPATPADVNTLPLEQRRRPPPLAAAAPAASPRGGRGAFVIGQAVLRVLLVREGHQRHACSIRLRRHDLVSPHLYC